MSSNVDWVILEDLIDITHGFAFKSEYFTSTPNNVILLTPGNFHIDQRLYFGENTKYYNGEYPQEYVLRNGDLVIVMTDLASEMKILGGAVIIDSEKIVLHNQRIGKISIRDPKRLDKLYLMYALNSNTVRKNIKATASGTTVRHTSPSRIKSNFILLPPVLEQRKIAEILSTWDEAIIQLERLINLLRQRKDALTERLLTGEIRFPGFADEWQKIQIGRLLVEVKRPIPWDDNATYNLISVRRRSGGLFLREIRKGSEIKTKGMNIALADDFLISKMQIVHGASGLTTKEFDGMHISGSYVALVTRDPQILDIRFFDWLSRTSYFYNLTYLSSYGVHIEKMTFNLSDFLKREIRIPRAVEEQRRIVSVLETAETEIRSVQRKLTALKNQKKGLMQKLLTGQIRVKV